MEEKPKRKSFKRGCLIWFLLLIALLVWNIQTSHHHPWSDERIMALFNENRAEFEEARDSLTLLKKERIIANYDSYDDLLAGELNGSATAIKKLVQAGVDVFEYELGCIRFGLNESMESGRLYQGKSILHCDDIEKRVLQMNDFNVVSIIAPDQDTDEFFRDPYCVKDGTTILRKIEGNWYIRHWLINSESENYC